MPITRASPWGSTSISAPQWRSQNSALRSSITFQPTSMYWCGKPQSSWSAFTIACTESPSIPIKRRMRPV